jgi:hypothetical protein
VRAAVTWTTGGKAVHEERSMFGRCWCLRCPKNKTLLKHPQMLTSLFRQACCTELQLLVIVCETEACLSDVLVEISRIRAVTTWAGLFGSIVFQMTVTWYQNVRGRPKLILAVIAFPRYIYSVWKLSASDNCLVQEWSDNCKKWPNFSGCAESTPSYCGLRDDSCVMSLLWMSLSL